MIVYVLSGESGEIYVGMTANLANRLASHRELKCKTTAKMFEGNFILEHYWEVPSFTLASKLERWLHIAGRSETIDLMLDVPLWCEYLHKLVSVLRTSAFEMAREAPQGRSPCRVFEPRTLYNL